MDDMKINLAVDLNMFLTIILKLFLPTTTRTIPTVFEYSVNPQEIIIKCL